MAPKQRALAALKASFVPPPSTTKRKRTVTIVPDSDDDYGDDDADFDPDRRSSATTSTPAHPASSSRLSRSSSVKKRPKTVRRSAAAGLSVDGESSGRTFGVASTDETVVASSNGLSTRRPPRLGAQSIQSLQRCALDSFSSGLRRLYLPDTKGGGLKADVRLQMSVLPDHLKLLVWQALVDSGSGLVRVDHVLLQHFVDLPTVVLTSNLPSLYNLKTLRAFPFTENTTRFVCTGLPKLEDSSIAYALKRMPGLEAVDLRGTSRAGDLTVQALEGVVGTLKELNVSETSVRFGTLDKLLFRARKVENLKMASIKGLNDSSLEKMIDTLFTAEEAEVLDTGPRPLSAVKTLKLRGNDTLGNTSIDKLLRYLPSLERLDLSFISSLRSLALPPAILPRLTKLHLTGTTKLSPSSIINQLVDTPCVALETLQLGALGGSDRPWTVDDVLMLGVVCALAKGSLRKLVLAGNATLVGSELAGIPSSVKVSAFSHLLVTVAPFVEHLDLSLVPLKSSYLTHAFGTIEDDVDANEDFGPREPPKLRELILDETGIDDGLDTSLARCSELEVLRLKNSKVSLTTLFDIFDHNTKLHMVDLTSCRGIPLRQRRGIFEAWEADRNT